MESKTSLKDAFKKVMDQKDEINWVIVSAKTGSVQMEGHGSGLSSLVDSFSDNDMQWGLFCVLGVDDGSTIKSVRSKLVQIDWCGDGVRHNDRGRMLNAQLPKIQKFAGAIACQISASPGQEITNRKIAFKLYHAQGAHKPTFYDFGDSKVECSSLNVADDEAQDDDEDEDFD
eukprot:CAMPEP_0197534624 /NCGR_PEP_ID=MMETSP1318-20131121/47767_1 /TAXON_ID=552666 /ORGANISM="Partenskyella glossopodia, Strain RCC365" /LENGTH=172 /DNA_ID=CAMNT_0043091957 /DNA_START=1 /DNA_END=519 /DNA_ORIENTATION=+